MGMNDRTISTSVFYKEIVDTFIIYCSDVFVIVF